MTSQAGAAVGARIRALRQERGLTLSALAAAAGIGKGSLSELESGRRNPTLETLYAVAGPLGVPLAALVDFHAGATVADEGFTTVLLHTEQSPAATSEIWLLQVARGVTRTSPAHSAGVVEQLVVLAGSCRVSHGSEVAEAGPGQHLSWPADVPHSYAATGDTDLRAINVIVTPRSVSQSGRQHQHQVATLDGLGAGQREPLDGAGRGRGDRGLHLHRLDGRDRVAGRHLLALLDHDRDHALERRGDVARLRRVGLLGAATSEAMRPVADVHRAELAVDRGQHRADAALVGVADRLEAEDQVLALLDLDLVLDALPQPVEVVQRRHHRQVAVRRPRLGELLGRAGEQQLVERPAPRLGSGLAGPAPTTGRRAARR